MKVGKCKECKNIKYKAENDWCIKRNKSVKKNDIVICFYFCKK